VTYSQWESLSPWKALPGSAQGPLLPNNIEVFAPSPGSIPSSGSKGLEAFIAIDSDTLAAKLARHPFHLVNSRRRDLRPHRTLEFTYGAFTPQETKERYTPPWNPSTRFPPASWGVYLTKIKLQM